MDVPSEASQAEHTTIYLYYMLSSAVTLFYDILVTWDQEIDNVWRHKFSVAGLLFVLNRYLNVILAIANLLNFFPVVQVTLGYCKSLNIVVASLQAATDLNSAAFSAVRVWAIWSRNWVIFVIVMVACLLAPILNVYRISTVHFVGVSQIPDAYGGCTWTSGLSTSSLHTLIVVARACAISADTLILGATLLKTIRIKKEAMKVGIPAKFTTMVIRDGSLWWGALVVVNIMPIVVDNLDTPGNPSTFFVNVVQSIMLSHFMLSLRKLYDPRSLELTSSPDIVGNLGASLTFPGEEDDLVFARTSRRTSSGTISFGGISSVAEDVLQWTKTPDMECPLDSLDDYDHSRPLSNPLLSPAEAG